MAHTYNPSTQKLRQEDWEFKANLGYVGRPLSQKTKGWVYSSAIEHLPSLSKSLDLIPSNTHTHTHTHTHTRTPIILLKQAG
jgi:hypothetical protein